MSAETRRVKLSAIQSLRALFLQETNFQIRYNATHERGWSDSYLLTLNGAEVGCGSVKGQDNIAGRDTVFECFVIRPFRTQASSLFRALLSASGARLIECQSNDLFLSALLFEHATTSSSSTGRS